MSLVNQPGNPFVLPLGVVAPQHQGMLVKNGFAGTLTAGTLVYVSTASRRAPTKSKTELTAPTVTKADADAAAPANIATWVVVKDIAQDAYGYVRKGLLLSADTSGFGAEGDPVYLSTTAGAVTATENTNAAQTNQRVGHVVGSPATAANGGRILYDLTIPVKRFANTAVTLTQVIDGSTVANTVIGAIGARALAAAEFGVPVQLVLEVGDVATGDVDFTGCPYKLYVTNVETTQVGAGNAGNSITVKNGANAITDAMNNATANGTDQAATLDPTHRTIAAGATIRISVVKAGGASSAKIVITALRIA